MLERIVHGENPIRSLVAEGYNLRKGKGKDGKTNEPSHPATRASPYEQATRQRSIKSDNTHLLRAEHRGTLADNAPKSSEDKRALRKSNNKRI